MPLSFRRLVPVVFVVCAALLSAGCESNNKGKIVGKWSAEGGLLVFEFTSDGRFIASGAVSVTGKYSLGAGDTVNLSNLSPPLDGKTRSREKITITGDSMSVAGGSGKSTTFTRMK